MLGVLVDKTGKWIGTVDKLGKLVYDRSQNVNKIDK